MLYVIFSHDIENSLALRVEARPAHVARLQELNAQGRLFVAGPLPAIDSEEPGDAGFTGRLEQRQLRFCQLPWFVAVSGGCVGGGEPGRRF